MTGSKLIDSSVWIEYFFNNKYKDLLDSSNILYLSSLSLFEITKKLKKEKVAPTKIKIVVEFIKRKSIIIPITTEIAEAAVEISLKSSLPMADSLIYASSRKCKAHLFTCDNDFRGLEEITILN